MERDRHNSIVSLFGSSGSPPQFDTSAMAHRGSSSSTSFDNQSLRSLTTLSGNQATGISAGLEPMDSAIFDESPFGPLKNAHTRKTFAYLIAILNSTYPDHDFSDLQPTTENFHKINSAEDLVHKFNNLMISLGKKEELLNWIWDTINVYMDFISPRTTSVAIPGSHNGKDSSRNNSLSQSVPKSGAQVGNESQSYNYENCQIYEFQPSDQAILEDLSYPFQTMWSYYWFIYNKKKKRVAFIYLKAINKIHYSKIKSENSGNNGQKEGPDYDNSNGIKDDEIDEDEDEDLYMNEYANDDMIESDNDDVIGDIEL
ncbi:hypothetical protein PGUG_01789 [Meyerozyma guilliermondii ATCC 6260]|uniref:Repressor of RNA polymerase III transcription MAF1 n=1 Tax=Meyerozyma guilliermondii (strain ATCC 6260 / CBS 566 / DSM 6381 / JCM 1539 / NBRC 10279 / NRRL Y-324) TaxID=294746 RepID=A5DET8_PICGU|nr:uncharacterized protein PGUG_01789 [Meyerozyma guilliermondii ATCC 6260]EDK37691.2 hypothetical protein PGUG_01789 [Meyerozyma guilliermondii ATCC 6260]